MATIVLDEKSSQEYPVNAGDALTLFLLYINDLPDDVICGIVIYADETNLCSKCGQASDLWQQQELNLTLIIETLWTGAECDLLISMLEKLNWFRLNGLITLMLMMGKWIGLFLRKKYLLRWLGRFLVSWI